jgi:hypothetical protein
MEERYVRCRRCHGVFESGVANCPRCGAEYVALDSPIPEEGSFEQKYKNTEFSPQPIEAPAVAPKQQGSKYGLILMAGAALTVAGLVVVMLIMSGVLGSPAATEQPDIVYGPTRKPSPSPTLPPVIYDTLRLISDPQFNGHVSIHTRVSVAAQANNGKAVAHAVTIEADMVDGDTYGTVQIDNSRVEFKLVEGVYYSRALPNGSWAARSSTPAFLVLSPLFKITAMNQIAFGGPTAQHGAAMEIVSTNWYKPDPLTITGIDMSAYPVKVDQWSLSLLLDNDGNPIYAEFHAWVDAKDGSGNKLIDIATTYDFSNVGQVVPGGTPGPSLTK